MIEVKHNPLIRLGFFGTALLTLGLMIFEFRGVRPCPEFEDNCYPRSVPALQLVEIQSVSKQALELLNVRRLAA